MIWYIKEVKLKSHTNAIRLNNALIKMSLLGLTIREANRDNIIIISLLTLLWFGITFVSNEQKRCEE
jgi:hypothetical protein